MLKHSKNRGSTLKRLKKYSTFILTIIILSIGPRLRNLTEDRLDSQNNSDPIGSKSTILRGLRMEEPTLLAEDPITRTTLKINYKLFCTRTVKH